MMQLEFERGERGYFEARALYRFVQLLRTTRWEEHAERELLQTLESAAEAQLIRPEYEPLRDIAAEPEVSRRAPSADGIWQRWFGPSRSERQLSAQRAAALERAERAERSAFESLAEMAGVARERDALAAELRALKKATEEAGNGSPAA